MNPKKFRIAGSSWRTTATVSMTAVVLTSLLAACGGSDPSNSSEPQNSGAGAEAQTVKIGLAVPGPTSAEPLLAESLGLYEKYGVNVELLNLGTTAATQAAAGRVDLAIQGCTSALPPAVSGRQTKIVYLLAGNGAGVSIAANSSITPQATPEESLLQLTGKRVAITGSAGNSAGLARAISKLLVSKGLEPLVLVNLSDASAVSSQILTGQIDAYVGPSEVLGGAIAAGKAQELISQDDTVLEPLGGGNGVAGVCAWGTEKQLSDKSKAIDGVVAAFKEASEYVKSHKPAEIAGELRKYETLKNQDVEVLTKVVNLVLPSKLGVDGSISADMWQNSLEAYAGWGFDLDMSSESLTYARIVDTSRLK